MYGRTPPAATVSASLGIVGEFDRIKSPKPGTKAKKSVMIYPPPLTEETVETLYLIGEQDRILGISGYAVRLPQVRKSAALTAGLGAGVRASASSSDSTMMVPFTPRASMPRRRKS